MPKTNGLSPKQKKFADKYIETGNMTVATIEAGYDVKNKQVAGSIGSENLKKPEIRAYIEANAKGAVSRIVELSIYAENETVRLNANKDILDRSGFKAVDNLDVTSNGERIVFAPIAVIGRLKENNEERIRVTPETNGSNQLPQEV